MFTIKGGGGNKNKDAYSVFEIGENTTAMAWKVKKRWSDTNNRKKREKGEKEWKRERI